MKKIGSINFSFLLILLVFGSCNSDQEVKSFSIEEWNANSRDIKELKAKILNEYELVKQDSNAIFNMCYNEYLIYHPEKAKKIIGMWPGSIKSYLKRDPDFIKIADKNKLNWDMVKQYIYLTSPEAETFINNYKNKNDEKN
jgi:hypothetical protein